MTGIIVHALRGQKLLVRKVIVIRVVTTSIKWLSEHAIKLPSKCICVYL